MTNKTSPTDLPRDSHSTSDKARRKVHWYQRIGPGLITASVVIGPGSILLSSQAGASFGFSLSWVVLAAAFFMMIFTTMASRLAVVADRSLGDLIRQRASSWLVALIGVCIFFISAAFEAGNNIGVHAAIEPYLDISFRGIDFVTIAFNGAAIAFVFFFKSIYRALEGMMKILVGLMVISFTVNFIIVRPDMSLIISNLVPNFDASKGDGLSTQILTIIALTGTTFVISAAYFQAYLARQKGWTKTDLVSGLIDARVASIVMALITLMIMWTAATVLRDGDTVSISRIASQLEPLFGGWGKAVFSVGLFSAAFSSFLVNSFIGGFILSDGLGLGSEPTDLGPKICTVVVLLTGMVIAQYTFVTGTTPLVVIRAAQAVTVITAPVVAGVLWWLASRKDIMGENRNSLFTNVSAGIGVVLLLIMSGRIVVVLVGQ